MIQVLTCYRITWQARAYSAIISVMWLVHVLMITLNRMPGILLVS